MDEPLRDGLDAGQQPEQLDGLRKPPPAPLPPPQQLEGLRVHLRRVGSQTGVVVRCAQTHAALLRQATAVLGMETAAERCFVASGDELGPEGFALIEPQETLYFCGGGEGWRPPRGHAAAAAAPAPTEARSLTNRSEMCDADRWHGMTKEASGPWHLLKRHCAAMRSLFSGHFIVDQWVGNPDLYADRRLKPRTSTAIRWSATPCVRVSYRGRTDLQQDLVNINTNIAQISALFLAGVAPALLTADISDATSESAHPCWRQLEETAAQELRPNCPPAGPRSVVQRPGPP